MIIGRGGSNHCNLMSILMIYDTTPLTGFAGLLSFLYKNQLFLHINVNGNLFTDKMQLLPDVFVRLYIL